jgi:hypothetical protein
MGISFEKGSGGHNLSAHAPSALWDLLINKCLLQRMKFFRTVGQNRCQAFNSGYLKSLGCAHRRYARPNRDSANVNRTGTTDSGTTAHFRTRQPQIIPQDPHKHFTCIAVDSVQFAIDM